MIKDTNADFPDGEKLSKVVDALTVWIEEFASFLK